MAKHSITIYGASDDLIEIEGDIRAEFGHYSDDEANLTASDGTCLRVVYDKDGIWRITRIFAGRAEFTKVEGDVVADTNDRVTLTQDEPFTFVTLGKQIAK